MYPGRAASQPSLLQPPRGRPGARRARPRRSGRSRRAVLGPGPPRRASRLSPSAACPAGPGRPAELGGPPPTPLRSPRFPGPPGWLPALTRRLRTCSPRRSSRASARRARRAAPRGGRGRRGWERSGRDYISREPPRRLAEGFWASRPGRRARRRGPLCATRSGREARGWTGRRPLWA